MLAPTQELPGDSPDAEPAPAEDAHTGAHSRRGDLETLGYNMVHWAAGTLPWLTELEDPEQVKFVLQNSQHMFS